MKKEFMYEEDINLTSGGAWYVPEIFPQDNIHIFPKINVKSILLSAIKTIGI